MFLERVSRGIDVYFDIVEAISTFGTSCGPRHYSSKILCTYCISLRYRQIYATLKKKYESIQDLHEASYQVVALFPALARESVPHLTRESIYQKTEVWLILR